jgi:hypothetical protein
MLENANVNSAPAHVQLWVPTGKSNAVPTSATGTCGFETAREGDLPARSNEGLRGPEPTHQQRFVHQYSTGIARPPSRLRQGT